MTSREFTHWKAFNRMEPIGCFRSDLRVAAALTSALNLWGSAHGLKEPFKVSDLILDFNEKKPEMMDPKAMEMMLREYAKAQGVVMKNGKKVSDAGRKRVQLPAKK